jgi:hypothetical protein
MEKGGKESLRGPAITMRAGEPVGQFDQTPRTSFLDSQSSLPPGYNADNLTRHVGEGCNLPCTHHLLDRVGIRLRLGLVLFGLLRLDGSQLLLLLLSSPRQFLLQVAAAMAISTWTKCDSSAHGTMTITCPSQPSWNSRPVRAAATSLRVVLSS